MTTSAPLLYVSHPSTDHQGPILKIALLPLRKLISHSFARMKTELKISGHPTISTSVFH